MTTERNAVFRCFRDFILSLPLLFYQIKVICSCLELLLSYFSQSITLFHFFAWKQKLSSHIVGALSSLYFITHSIVLETSLSGVA